MLARKKLASLLVFAACLSQVSCLNLLMARPSGPSHDQLMQAVRQYGQNRPPAPAAQTLTTSAGPDSQASPARETEEDYDREILATFNAWDFAKLESEVREARATKGRVVGGSWKLYEFYDAVSKPLAGDNANATEWSNLFEVLNQWKTAQPQSAAAHIAYAEALSNYGWSFRGSGYADTVTASREAAYEEQTTAAAAALLEAAALPEKCPFWYQTMEEVALDQGWSKSDAAELVDQAAAFEPTFYHYYRQHGNYLLTKWYGDEGESERFITESADKIGGQQGDLIYFLAGSVTVCTCETDKPPMDKLSWPRLQRGYIALDQLYGVSHLQANRFALMAFAENDKATARKAFALVGDDPRTGVWRSRQSFEDAKAWALDPQ